MCKNVRSTKRHALYIRGWQTSADIFSMCDLHQQTVNEGETESWFG